MSAVNISDAVRSAEAPVSVWGVSAFELAELVLLAAPEFGGRARLQVINDHFDGAEAKIRERLQHDRCDVLVSAGANADYLRASVNLPVVAVQVGGYDVMAALTRARQISERMALLLHRQAPREVEQFLAVFGIELEVRAYDTESDARNVVKSLVASGVCVVIGAGLAVRVAHENGVAGVFLYSAASVSRAIEEAVQLVHAQRRERAQRQALSSVLSHLEEGVIAVDGAGRITAANRAADALTGCALGVAIGTSLPELVPSLNPSAVLNGGPAELSAIRQFQRRSVAVDAAPLLEDGRTVGAVYTLHPAAAVESAFRKLRAHEKTRRPSPRYTLSQVVQASAQMQAVVRHCETVAAHSDFTLLISGPSGVGKELLAQGIHNASRRRAHEFVAVNCGALTESLVESEFFGYEDGAFTGARRNGKAGLFEAAHRGTLFLDEIAELPLLMQTRLLRVLQEREVTRVGAVAPVPVDVRVIAATHGDLAAMVRTGKFRQDLYYRLAVLRITVPPLCDRPEDVRALAQQFVTSSLREAGIAKYLDAILDVIEEGLAGQSWPGNGREIENASKRIAIACVERNRPLSAAEIAGLLDAEFAESSAPIDLAESSRRQERRHVEAVLAASGGNQAEAARKLGISRTTLWRKLQKD